MQFLDMIFGFGGKIHGKAKLKLKIKPLLEANQRQTSEIKREHMNGEFSEFGTMCAAKGGVPFGKRWGTILG